MHDLIEENILSLTVSKQVVHFDGWLCFVDDCFDSLVSFLDSIKCDILIDIFDFFSIKLVMESLDCVSEGGRLLCTTRVQIRTGTIRPRGAWFWSSSRLFLILILIFVLLMMICIQSMLDTIVHANFIWIHKLLPRVLSFE